MSRRGPAPPLVTAAKQRTLVTLSDGRQGRLVHVGQQSGKSKVWVGGRHVRVPTEWIIELHCTADSAMQPRVT